jgi:DNA-binding transcriptional ArsR family regulator
MEETYINISLGDEKAKDIAEILSNKSCKKILELLTEKELTETEIAEKLNLPLNTVDYNVKKILKSGLIESTSHWWSVKGKKMPSYKISNKKIIISPKKFSTTILLLPTLAIGGAITYIIKKLTTERVTDQLLQTSSYGLPPMPEEAATTMTKLYEPIVTNTQFIQTIHGWQWFLIGIWLGIILFFAINYFYDRKRRYN